MKNSILCSSCKKENPFYRTTCLECKTYLRDKVYNLNFSHILSLLIENPAKAFKQIIFSEQKNFIIFLVVLIAVKYLVTIRFVSMITLGEFRIATSLIASSGIVLVAFSLFISLSALLFSFFCKSVGILTRFKDNLSIIIYSQVLLVIGLLILLPIELILFGDYLFSLNPTPFEIKPLFAWVFLSLEIILILWSFILLSVGFNVQLRNTAVSIFTSSVFWIGLSALLISLSLFIYTI